MPTEIIWDGKPTGQFYYERTELGLPLTVHNLDGITKRAVLRSRIPLILVHYTGVSLKQRPQGYAGVDTQSELASAVQAINRWRRNEYNYVIPQNGDIAEFAGRFQGAHCGNWPAGTAWNPNSYGVLFLNAVEEPPTWDQIVAFGWLKNVMRWTQQIPPDVRTEPHKFAKPTGCPGVLIEQAMDGLRSL